ncbi:hypothetical protein AYJ58_10580 [Shewanella sp. Pdp11]|uniref:hypothetical protein n=1 Tax=Shewanella sp. Pdp11 TaxID=2059264 RepID=UPI000CA1AA2E|nr:hypothetical protein [Shewanella sp. Pdp11]AUD59913.1 hypothetical protein AYJ58_10580 [Shewanella sp. Pdp11]
MSNILRAYAFPTFQLIGVIGISVCSLWFSGWYSQGEKGYISSFNSLPSNQQNPITTASFWDVTSHNAFSFSKPVPYTALALVIGLVGGFGGFRNQHKINKFDALEAKYRAEKNNHGETQRQYYEAIGYIIQSIFVSTDDAYDNTCRVTIYRHTNDNHLQRIFRHATQSRFESGGRLRIPDDEGVVGAAWLNNGVAHVSLQHGFSTQSYNQQLEKELAQHGAKLPSSRTNMPTRNYFAMAVRAPDKTKMAVIVLESTEPDKFSRERLERLISQENGDIAKYIIHKGKLDEILNPDGDLENG